MWKEINSVNINETIVALCIHVISKKTMYKAQLRLMSQERSCINIELKDAFLPFVEVKGFAQSCSCDTQVFLKLL